MNKKEITFIAISTLVCMATLIALINSDNYFNIERDKNHYNAKDKGRNERSTPRTFILPATPAVALVQEKKRFLIEHEVQIKHCMLKLHDLGYKIMNFEDIFDIHIYIALMDYQMLKGLPITGEFDEETISRLGCKG